MNLIKTTQENETTRITIYSVLSPSNILRFNHIVSKRDKEDENYFEEYVVIEYNLLSEQSYPVPLKVGKRIKQTKQEEFFVYEQVEKTLLPLTQRVVNSEEVQKITNFCEQASI